MTDTVTGLIWLKHLDCLSSTDWVSALQAAAGLKDADCGGTLTDGSSPGDWRLPTRAEWEATIARAVALGCFFGGASLPPSLMNDAGTACYGDGTSSSFAGVGLDRYWSSSSSEAFLNVSRSDLARSVDFLDGEIQYNSKDAPVRVWPVRGGSR